MFRSSATNLALLLLCVPAVHAQGVSPVTEASVAFSRVTVATSLPDGIDLRDGAMHLRITALRPDVLRVRGSRTAALPEDSSWAVLAEARQSSSPVTPQQDGNTVGFDTASLHVRVARATGLLTVTDSAGNVLEQQEEPLTFTGQGYRLSSRMSADEHDFGLGDKTGPFDHRDEVFRMWNTDAYAWQESTDPLYKDIPFFLSYRAGTTLGVLVDNTWPCTFDFGKTEENVFQYRAEGGPVDMYLLYGPDAKHVLGSYAWLTGPTPLPPLWALGFQQSRFSYMTQDRVLQVADRLRSDRIPADAMYLDIDYQDRNRPFTVNKSTFPDFEGMVHKLHDEQFHVVAITDLHIADLPGAGYAPFDSGLAGHNFVTNPDGSLYVGPVWPGPSVFPDFTRQATRNWWGTLYTGLVAAGVDGFWNDMNEPSVFNALKTMPNDTVHHIEEPGFSTRTATHREIHNVYGMENARATDDGLLVLRPDERPFVLTRAAYAGTQRYAATWTGDNSATWNHLRLTVPMLKNLGLSGFSLAGADVGGYAGTPTPELLTKWIELGAFQPIDRDHAEKGTGDHEVWANGPEQESTRRRFIETRYRLLPYLYTTMESGTRTGLPLLRPLFLEFPNAAPDRHPLDVDITSSGEYLFGPDLLVAPPPFPDKTDSYNVTLPGEGWYDFWTGQPVRAPGAKVVAGGLQPEAAAGPTLPTVHIAPELASLPVFVRPGAILPVQPLVQSTADVPRGPLTLRVFPGPDCSGALYQDDGKSFRYRDGDFLRVAFSCTDTPDTLTIRVGPHQGRYPAWWTQLQVEVNGLDAPPRSVQVEGRDLSAQAGSPLTLLTEDSGKGVTILIHKR